MEEKVLTFLLYSLWPLMFGKWAGHLSSKGGFLPSWQQKSLIPTSDRLRAKRAFSVISENGAFPKPSSLLQGGGGFPFSSTQVLEEVIKSGVSFAHIFFPFEKPRK